MYKSPIEIIQDIQEQVTQQIDEHVVNTVNKFGIIVDKEELVKALLYDRKQYDKGYADAHPEQPWIPTSESLPELNRDVLITTSQGYVAEGEYDGMYDEHDAWIQYRWSATLWDDEVIAWMPLPEPYKGDKVEEQPTIEPQIIRCKDCKHYDSRPCGIVGWYNTADDFCSRAEGRQE